MRVLLIYPNANQELIGWGDLGAIAEPLALEYLASGALERGDEVRLLDLRLHPDGLDNAIESFQPDIAALTGYSMHVLRNLAICRRIKELHQAAITVIGGHHATLLPEDFFAPEIDAVVCGEGVWPFTRILERIDQGASLAGIPGVWHREAEAFHSGGPPRTFEIDDIPHPDRTLTGIDRQSYFIDWMRPIALLRTSVGCPYRCSFCSLWRIMDGKYHMRDTQRIIEELHQIQEPYIFLVDDEPFVNRRRMADLAEAIEESGIQKEYFAYCRVDSLLRERELMTRWRDVGLKRVFLGIEAISEKGLEEYNKRIQLRQVEQALEEARNLGIDVFAQFIVNTNFTPKDFKRLVRFIQRNNVTYPSFTILTPIPGTDALNNTFDGVIERQANGRPNWELFDLQNVVTDTAMPKKEFLAEYHRLHEIFMDSYLNYRKEVLMRDRGSMPVYC